MKEEEYSIMGLVLLLFGVTFLLFAEILLFEPAVLLFFIIGICAVLIGVVMLFLRWYLFAGPGRLRVRSRETTPANFLKKCPNCGREVPIAAEKCYSCGGRV